MNSHESTARGPEKTFPSDAEVLDSVFITPRVIDAGAFREYAESLKGLIREAGGRRTELRTDAEEARQLRENLSEAANRLRERLETTAKLLPALDNRVRRAEQAMAQAEDHANLPAQLEERIGKHIAAMEARVQAASDAAEARLAAIERRYDELQSRAEADLQRLEGIGGDLHRTASAATEALEGAEARTAALRAEVSEATERAGARFEERTETLVARADQAYASLGQSVSEILARADERVASIETQIAPFLASTDAVPEALRAHVERAQEAIDAHAAEALKRAQAVEMLCERAVRLLGFDPDRPSDEILSDSLMMLVQRGDALERTARATAEELAALHEANARTLERLQAAETESGASIDQLVRLREDLTASIASSMATLGEVPTGFLEEVVAARGELVEVEERRRKVEAGVAGLSEEIASLENQVAERLGALRVAVTEDLTRLQRAVELQRRAAAGGPEGLATEPGGTQS